MRSPPFLSLKGVLGDKVGYNIAFGLALLMATVGTFFDFIPRYGITTRQSSVFLTRGPQTSDAYSVDSMLFVPQGCPDNLTNQTCVYQPFNVTDLQCDFGAGSLVIPQVHHLQKK